jgi:hypothetical protein
LEEAEEFAETVVKHVTERYPQVIFAWQVENEPWEVGPAASRTHLLSTREKVLYLSGVADAVRRVDQRNPTVLTTNMKWSTVLSGLTAEEVSLLLSDVDVLGLNLYPYWSGLRDDGREAFQYLTEVAEDGTAEAEKYGKKMWVIEIPIVSHANGGPQCLEAARWIVFI